MVTHRKLRNGIITLVPQEISCQLQNAYTMSTLTNVIDITKYCGKLVNIC